MELLAPAGNAAALKAAVYAGCDAVYLGVDAFNARAKADNFTCENIKEYIDFCHLYGVKVYIAFNTAVKDKEMPLLRKKVNVVAGAGADAFIVTDFGALDIFYDSGVPLHASTQMGIHNLEGALAAKELGFKRIVLSRECRLEDIEGIKKSGLEVEVFVHGALCVSFSGGCLMSSFMSGDSGNRGRCNQPCRMKYKCGSEKGYFLSPSDLCRIEDLDKLKRVGVDSCKIEGRLKTPYYVAETVSAYAKALKGEKLGDLDYSRLKRAFNRGGFTRGYDLGDGKSLMSVNVPNNCGEQIGVISVVGKGYIDVKTMSDISVGDGIKITRDGAEISGLQVDKLIHIKDGVRISCNSYLYKAKDIVSITYDKSRSEELLSYKKLLQFSAQFSASVGNCAILELSIGEESVVVKSDNLMEQALNHATDKGSIQAVLDKDCNEFICGALEVKLDNKCFVPKSVINDMRKRSLNELREKILNKYNQRCLKRINRFEYKTHSVASNMPSKELKSGVITVISDNIEALKYVAHNGGNCVLRINDFKNINFLNIINSGLFKNNSRIFLSVPKILRLPDMSVFKEFLNKYGSYFEGLYCDNIGAVYLARQYGLKAFGDIGLNIYNKNCVNMLGLDGYCASCELNLGELMNLQSPTVYAYGKPVVMTVAHCPVKLICGGDCSNCKYKVGMKYSDSYGDYIIRRVRVSSCYFELLNPDLIDFGGNDERALKGSNYLLDMIEYDSDTIARVYNAFACGNNKGGCSGHLHRGVK